MENNYVPNLLVPPHTDQRSMPSQELPAVWQSPTGVVLNRNNQTMRTISYRGQVCGVRPPKKRLERPERGRILENKWARKRGEDRIAVGGSLAVLEQRLSEVG